MSEKQINLLIITGMSGAGKTVAVQSLEDLGFFCVDNLPPLLIPKFAELIEQSGGRIKKVALVIDLRGREFFDTLSDALIRLDEMEHIHYQILFLDSSDQVLVQRYKETRRRHPLAPEGLPMEGIFAERRMLEEIKGRANLILDSSQLKPVQLKEKISNYFSTMQSQMTVNITSFGFKYGIPIDADLVFDVRFLPNPHYIEELRPKTGLDQEVSGYVFQWDESVDFVKRLIDFIGYTLPHYQKEGKAQLVIGIGCTGGKHRSVSIAEYLGQKFKDEYLTRVSHRDIDRDRK
ncbi:RNase adapter RapZ [Ammoniphilus sp. CFH 90114]|uniref:RNase adapter RapZ n=1 Tax=Ammoniphilus sp. CFH 90114 TaxID=2493665 RepID=UPI00100FEC58|nr:RNase adapter RapZ [Ammoniphilus sp. CFH 90114]RXT04035.1 RNase adapter RapZ [Ammoniphilus sp. CFH 90114]